VNKSVSAVIGLSAAFALASPVGGRGAALPIHKAIDRDSDAQALLRTGNPVPLMTRPSEGAPKRGWIQFKTDECGTLLAIDNDQSSFTRASLDDGDEAQMDGPDGIGDMDGTDMDDMDDQDPADLGKALIGRWLSTHPEIAVIADGINKVCDDGPYFDEDLPSDIEALSPKRPARTWNQAEPIA
jgi:hypothetical protein